MATEIQLIGPPELRSSPAKQVSERPRDLPSPPDSSFMDLMVQNFNNTELQDKPQMGFTENGSATFLASGNPCLDFFFHIVPDTPREGLIERLEKAWEHNPLTTLKLICNLRGVRGSGKSDKEGFYTAALWLHKNHPKTLACNVRSLAGFGYFKDLPELLFRLLEGIEVRKIAKEEWEERSGCRSKGRRHHVEEKSEEELDKLKMQKQEIRSKVPKEERILAEAKKAKLEQEKARSMRKENIIAKARKALERYNNDPAYRFLHDQISELFAECLVSDLQSLNSGEIRKISLAAKWCPNLDSSFDQSTLLCEMIAKRVFPRESNPEYEGMDEAHYAYRIRDRLRKEILVSLHQVLELPELYMSSKRWDSLPYNRVPSVAMKNYKKIFEKHDEERFKQYLDSVKRGETTIAAGALLPHEIIASLEDEVDSENDSNVPELQWRRMVQDLTEKGKLTDCLAICDVSGSMSGTPLDVSVALGLLVSEISEEPWKGKLITFSESPQLHKIEGDDLRSKTTFIRQMDWGMNTDFQKVFDLILQVAVNGKLSDEKMIKRVFVFSDMEFDEASANDWETDYEAIKRKFNESGYQSVPEIVFWNLRDSRATPTMSEQKGVAMVSGFSKNLLTLFLEGVDKMTPEGVMEMAISGKEYQKLVVCD